MRLFGAVFIAAVIMFGLQTFFSFRQASRTPPEPRRIARTSDEFSARVTLTFNAAADDFALDEQDQVALTVESVGQRIYEEADPIPAGTSITFPLKEQSIGGNELFIRATVASGAEPVQRAMRVQILRGRSLVVAQESFWAEPGEPVQGTIRFDAAGEAAVDHEEDHPVELDL